LAWYRTSSSPSCTPCTLLHSRGISSYYSVRVSYNNYYYTAYITETSSSYKVFPQLHHHLHVAILYHHLQQQFGIFFFSLARSINSDYSNNLLVFNEYHSNLFKTHFMFLAIFFTVIASK
jgi:hypothetical protein